MQKKLGIKTTISYICGLDDLQTLKIGFEYLCDSFSEFPIINIYQIQTYEQARILNEQAKDLSYYLESRAIIERVFENKSYKPKRWTNYRPLWYDVYNDVKMVDNAFGQKKDWGLKNGRNN